MERGYEGAKTGRRIDDWILQVHLPMQRLVNPLPRYVNAPVIWCGITALVAVRLKSSRATLSALASPRRLAPSPTSNRRIMEAWRQWCDECDADGHLDYYGIQALVARSMKAANVFIRFRDRTA